MKLTRLALLTLALLSATTAAAQFVRVPAQTETWVNCASTSTTLLAADNNRTAVAFRTTSATAVFIHSGTDAATDSNSAILDADARIWNNNVGSVYVGAWTCKGDGASVSVNIVTRP